MFERFRRDEYAAAGDVSCREDLRIAYPLPACEKVACEGRYGKLIYVGELIEVDCALSAGRERSAVYFKVKLPLVFLGEGNNNARLVFYESSRRGECFAV